MTDPVVWVRAYIPAVNSECLCVGNSALKREVGCCWSLKIKIGDARETQLRRRREILSQKICWKTFVTEREINVMIGQVRNEISKDLKVQAYFCNNFFCSYAHHFPASCVFKALHQELKVFTVASELWLHSQLLCSPVGVREHFSAKHRLPRSARTRGFKSLLLYLFGTISSSICCFVFYPLWCFSRTPCQIILILKMTSCITGRFYQQSK